MRTRTTINFVLCSFAAAALMTSCHGGGASGDFKTDATTSVQYQFIKHADTGAKPGEGDFVHVAMLWTGKNVKGDADSVYLDSHLKGKGDSLGALMFPLRKSFNGCLEQGIMMMSKGDSAIFKVNADSLYVKTFHVPAEKIPAAAKTSQSFTFSIKLIGFQTQKDMMAQRQAMMQKRMEEAQANKAKEPGDIAEYLKKNNFTGKPDADSIFYLKTVKGKGKEVKEGDSIEIQYRGTFTDGTSFDPPANSGKQVSSFKIVYSKNMALIKGWVSILGKMNEGEKVTVLIPSAMAYGPQGRGSILPYTPLVFDMELLSVKSNK
jgi:FKBP-type peptidyl-prolyl cis-trans isomerase FkpA